jgi:glycosyltransferase involved in cell wall biosynthesis
MTHTQPSKTWLAPVSTVIPCYCCSETIGRALASIAAQTILPHEVILVEDASPDGGATLDALRNLADEYGNVFVVKVIALMKNSGAGSARNRGWDAAGQPYIAFLDADDAWHPKKIEIQYGWMSDHPEYGLVGHAHVLQKGSDRSWPVLGSDVSVRSISKNKALVSNPFATRTVMLKRDMPFRFKEGKRYAEDYLLWLQILQSDVPSAYLDVPLASSYKDEYGSAGLSSRLWKMEAGVLDTYWVLHKEGDITLVLAFCLSIYSLAKYVRRVGIVLGRRSCVSHESVAS